MKEGEQRQRALEQDVRDCKEKNAQVERERSALSDDIDVLREAKSRLDEAFVFFLANFAYININI